MCDFLNVKRLSSLQITHYEQGARQQPGAEIVFPLRADIKGKRVLLVDDVNDTGETLLTAEEHLTSLEPSLLKSAVMHEKENDVFATDYTGKNSGNGNG